MTTMYRAKVFNPHGNDDAAHRSIWRGNTTNLVNLNDVRYNWATGLNDQMIENFWIPEKVDLSQDVNDFKQLTEDERRTYKGILSYLTFLDSTQTVNLPNLKLPITAPEVGICVATQIFQEAIHNKSYQVLIEAIIPSDERNAVYDFWRDDLVLRERCDAIASLYQKYVDYPSEENYFVALIADYLLEGLFFFPGFMVFYNFASRHLMPGSADMIRYINR